MAFSFGEFFGCAGGGSGVSDNTGAPAGGTPAISSDNSAQHDLALRAGFDLRQLEIQQRPLRVHQVEEINRAREITGARDFERLARLGDELVLAASRGCG